MKLFTLWQMVERIAKEIEMHYKMGIKNITLKQILNTTKDQINIDFDVEDIYDDILSLSITRYYLTFYEKDGILHIKEVKL
jgi:hypothetical protein